MKNKEQFNLLQQKMIEVLIIMDFNKKSIALWANAKKNTMQHIIDGILDSLSFEFSKEDWWTKAEFNTFVKINQTILKRALEFNRELKKYE